MINIFVTPMFSTIAPLPSVKVNKVSKHNGRVKEVFEYHESSPYFKSDVLADS